MSPAHAYHNKHSPPSLSGVFFAIFEMIIMFRWPAQRSVLLEQEATAVSRDSGRTKSWTYLHLRGNSSPVTICSRPDLLYVKVTLTSLRGGPLFTSCSCKLFHNDKYVSKGEKHISNSFLQTEIQATGVIFTGAILVYTRPLW